VDIDAQAASIATPGEWRVWRLAVANGPNIFQMLLVIRNYTTLTDRYVTEQFSKLNHPPF